MFYSARGYDWRDGDDVARNEGKYSTVCSTNVTMKLVVVFSEIYSCHVILTNITGNIFYYPICQLPTLQRDHAVKLIKEHDQSQIFYLYLPFTAVHSTIQSPQEFIDLYDKSIPEPRCTFLGEFSKNSTIFYFYVLMKVKTIFLLISLLLLNFSNGEHCQ